MPKARSLKQHRMSWSKAVFLGIAVALLVLGGTIAARLTIALQQNPQPQAILVLEGNDDRVPYAAEFWQLHANLPIWVSGNRRKQAINQAILQQAGVPSPQIFFDFCAIDTLTNFTCNVEAFKSRRLHHVYLVTSDYHMNRSLAIATLVFGSQGIAVSPILVASSGRAPEALWRLVRDCIRSLVWLATGFTGAELV